MEQDLPNTHHLNDQLVNLDIIQVGAGPSYLDVPPLAPITGVMQPLNAKNKLESCPMTKKDNTSVVRIFSPEELGLEPANRKRGRPKRRPVVQQQKEPKKVINVDIKAKIPRTRSGRAIKVPQYMEKDYKKIETSSEQPEVQVSDFKRIEVNDSEGTTELQLLQTPKRTIQAQFRCPTCSKAYLGKNKMIKHLTKYPDHGPLPENLQKHNFDVWNYLYDITQKCKPGQKGLRFCEELSNLLHNVQLLKSSLFRTVTEDNGKNCVNIDKVLGNAIGLPPGKYRFDEGGLYKDVTIYNLITSEDFFKPNFNRKNTYENSKENKSDTSETMSAVSTGNVLEFEKCDEADKTVKETSNNEKILASVDSVHFVNGHELDQSLGKDQEINLFNNEMTEGITKDAQSPNQSFTSKIDLLSENALLNSLSANTRNSVDDAILSVVENSSSILDNAINSYELINVDQFVNERFKKITEPDSELNSCSSLNLDLPTLDLFHFHSS